MILKNPTGVHNREVLLYICCFSLLSVYCYFAPSSFCCGVRFNKILELTYTHTRTPTSDTRYVFIFLFPRLFFLFSISITFFFFRSILRGVTKQSYNFFFHSSVIFVYACQHSSKRQFFFPSFFLSFFSFQAEQTCYFIFLLRHLSATRSHTKSFDSFLVRNRKKQYYSFYLCN